MLALTSDTAGQPLPKVPESPGVEVVAEVGEAEVVGGADVAVDVDPAVGLLPELQAASSTEADATATRAMNVPAGSLVFCDDSFIAGLPTEWSAGLRPFAGITQPSHDVNEPRVPPQAAVSGPFIKSVMNVLFWLGRYSPNGPHGLNPAFA
jgi:hypothetical protein